MAWEWLDEDILGLDAQMLALQEAAPPPPPEEPGLFTKYIKRPVFSALGKSQNLLTEPLFGETDAYKQASAELEKSFGREPGAWEALPGMGDVAVQNFSPEFRQSTLGGRLVEPLARMAGNIVGDPLTYVGGTILKGAGALGKGAVNAGRAAKAVEVARAGEAVGALPRIAEAGAAVGDLADAAHAAYYTRPAALDALEAGLKSHNRVRKYQATSELIRAGIEAGADPAVAKTYDFLAKAGMGADIAMLAATAVTGGPDIAVAASQAGKEAWQALEEGEYGKAGASATTAALMGGLGTLLAVGSIDSYRAVKTLQQHVATTKPGLVPLMSQNAAEAAAAEGSLEEAAAAAKLQQMEQPGAEVPQLSNLPDATATETPVTPLQAIEPEAVAPPPLRTEPIVGAEGPVLNESAPSAAPEAAPAPAAAPPFHLTQAEVDAAPLPPEVPEPVRPAEPPPTAPVLDKPPGESKPIKLPEIQERLQEGAPERLSINEWINKKEAELGRPIQKGDVTGADFPDLQQRTLAHAAVGGLLKKRKSDPRAVASSVVDITRKPEVVDITRPTEGVVGTPFDKAQQDVLEAWQKKIVSDRRTIVHKKTHQRGRGEQGLDYVQDVIKEAGNSEEFRARPSEALLYKMYENRLNRGYRENTLGMTGVPEAVQKDKSLLFSSLEKEGTPRGDVTERAPARAENPNVVEASLRTQPAVRSAEEERVLNAALEKAGGEGIEGLRRYTPEQQAERAKQAEDFPKRLENFQNVLEEKQKGERSQGVDPFVWHLRTLPKDDLVWYRNAESKAKGESPQISVNKSTDLLGKMYKAYRKLGDVGHIAITKEMGIALPKSTFSRLRGKLDAILSKVEVPPQFDVGESVAQRRARQESARVNVKKLTNAEAVSGLQSTPDAQVRLVPERQSVGSRDRKGVEGVTAQVQHPNGVWLEVTRADTPDRLMSVGEEGGRVVVNLKNPKAPVSTAAATFIHISNVGEVGGKGVRTPEEVAQAIRAMVEGNRSVRSLSLPLGDADGVRVAMGSWEMERALQQLEKDGVIERVGVAKAHRAPAGEAVLVGGKPIPGAVRTNVHGAKALMDAWADVHQLEKIPNPSEADLEALGIAKKKAQTLSEGFKAKAGEQQRRFRAEAVLAKQQEADAKLNNLAAHMAQNPPELGPKRVPTDRIYHVKGSNPLTVAEVMKPYEHRADLPGNAEAIDNAAILDAYDNPHRHGDVVLVNPDYTQTFDPEIVGKFAAAHQPMYAVLERVVKEVAEELGLGNTFGGVMVSPMRHGLIVGPAGKLGDGKILTNMLGALYHEYGNVGAAARRAFDTQILHEISHAVLNSTEHGGTHEQTMVDLIERLSKLEAPVEGVRKSKRERWIEQLSDPTLWGDAPAEDRAGTGLRGAYNDYVYRVNEVHDVRSARDRASRARVEEGVGGVRAGAAEGRAPIVPDRLPAGKAGAQDSGGVRIQPIEPLPKGVRGAGGELGEAPAGGRGGEQVGGERPAAGVAAGREEGGRWVASYRPNPSLRSIEEARRSFAELIGRRGAASELVRDGMQLASEMTRLLDDGKASDPALMTEWSERVKSKPAGSGAEHSLVNSLRSQLSDEAKVRMSIYSELAAGNSDLRKLYSVHTPVSMDAIGAAGMDILGVRSPEELARMFEKGGRKMSLPEQHALRIAATDVLHNHDLADKAWTKASAEWYQMPDGPAKDAFYDKNVLPRKTDLDTAASRMNIVRAAVNLGTEKGRELALHKQMRLTSDILSQNYNQMREGLREFLRPRYPNKRELDGVINMLMERREALEKKPDWSSVGVVEWNKAYQKAFNFSNFDKFLQFYKAGLLGFPSRGANVLSNAIFVNGIRWQEKNLAAMLEHAQAKWQGRTPEGFAQEIMLTPMVMRRGLSAAMKTWSKAQWDALTMKPIDYSSRSLDVSDDLIKIPSAIGGKLGEFISYIFKSMNADDGFFKHLVKVDHYYRKVFRGVMNGAEGYEVRPGETKYTATERIVGELEQNIRDAYDRGQKMEERFGDVHGEAQEMAQKDTFQEAMPGFMKSIQQTLYTGPGKAGQVPIPFVKTPFNIAKQVLLRTPVIGWGMDAAHWKKMTHAERMDATARHLTSATMAAGLIALTDGEEKLSGSGPMDPEANMLKQQTGWRPYSIKVGDKWISYQRLEPFSSLLGMLSDIQEGKRQGDFDKVDTMTSRLLGSVAENITNKTFLSGFTNMTEAVSDPIRYMDRFLKSVETSLVPNTIGFLPFGHLAQAMDPIYREVSLNPLEVIKSKTPGLSQTLQPQYTPAGEIRKRPDVLGVPILSPIKYSTIRTDPVAKAAGVLSDIGFPMRRVRNEVDYKGVRVPLEPEEQKRLVKAQNDAMLFIGKQLLNDPTFQRLPDNEDDADYPGQKTKKDVLARIVRRYRNPVMNSLNPLLRERAATRLKGQRAADAGA